jgi:DNA replication and repair protein RecF
VHVSRLELVDFRSYERVELDLEPGVTAFLGPNGQGKTNLVEAIDYAATQSSHRVASDQPLVRLGAERAVVRVKVRRDDREALIELELNPGKANRARLNRGAVPRARDVVGIVRTVLFAPDDLELVKGDPSARRRFMDDLLVVRQPRLAGVRADYERLLRQRNTLLKTLKTSRAGSASGQSALATLDSWDAHLAQVGGDLLAARLDLVAALEPHVGRHYAAVADSVAKADDGNRTGLAYRASLALDGASARGELEAALLAEMARRRSEELDRGMTLVGPHRDDLEMTLGPLPARGYASHGESWSLALALRLAAFDLLRADGDDPVLILDDVFAELDAHRRECLAAIVREAEQVLVTAAVEEDVPKEFVRRHYAVQAGEVRRVS